MALIIAPGCKVIKIICVAGPYHGQRIERSKGCEARISVDGALGQIIYVLRVSLRQISQYTCRKGQRRRRFV